VSAKKRKKRSSLPRAKGATRKTKKKLAGKATPFAGRTLMSVNVDDGYEYSFVVVFETGHTGVSGFASVISMADDPAALSAASDFSASFRDIFSLRS